MSLAALGRGRAAAIHLGLDPIVGALDHARARCIRWMARAPVLGRLVRRRDARLAMRATASVLLAFAGAAALPGQLLLLGPLLLGVPHLVSELRYLVLRPALPRSLAVGLGAAALALVAVRAFEATGAPSLARAEVVIALAAGLTSLICGARAAAAPPMSTLRIRFALGALALSAAIALGLARPEVFRAIATAAHPLVALVFWLALFRRKKCAVVVPLVLLAAGTALLAVGDLHAPGSLRALVFLQAIHYAVWLGWIPDDAARGAAPPTLRMSMRAMRRELGSVGIFVAAGATLAVPAIALAGAHLSGWPTGVRDAWLSLASFHGYLELALLLYFFVRGRRMASPAPRGVTS